MKPASLPICLLLFLQLATSAPIPIPIPTSTTSLPDCAYRKCHPSLLRLFSTGAKPNTPASKVSNPHFPAYQSAYPSTVEEEEAFKNSPFDSSPLMPSSEVPPSITLASTRPLDSAYLRSLSSMPTEEDVNESTDGAAAKPTSSLPELRKADMKVYWSEQHAFESAAKSNGAPTSSETWKNSDRNMLLPGNIYIKSHNTSQRGDFMVVGIVLLFLVIVITVEGADKIREFKNYICGTKPALQSGGIFLVDDEAFIVKKPLCIHASPSAHTSPTKESFQHNKDASSYKAQ